MQNINIVSSLNPNASVKVMFGDNVASDKILKSIITTLQYKQDNGMITSEDASCLLDQIKSILKKK